MPPAARALALLLTGLLTAAPGCASERFDLAGGWGFDWTRPEQARCTAITAAAARWLGPCRFETDGAFGLPLAHHQCAIPGGGEMLVFRNRDQCTEALETMQANAP